MCVKALRYTRLAYCAVLWYARGEKLYSVCQERTEKQGTKNCTHPVFDQHTSERSKSCLLTDLTDHLETYEGRSFARETAPERGEQMLRALYERLHDAANDNHIAHVSTYEYFGKFKVLRECVVMIEDSCATPSGICLW